MIVFDPAKRFRYPPLGRLALGCNCRGLAELVAIVTASGARQYRLRCCQCDGPYR
jgi:hypothetical protein